MAPQFKRRKLENAVEEISFDPDARHEFLTGFHKRKVQRIKLAQEHAEKRAREEKREERRKIREQRAAEIEQALNESKRMLEQIRGDASSQESGSDSDSEEEEWQGFEEPAPVDYEEEYIDEDKYTTVTVEEMGLSKDELHKQDKSSDDEDDKKHKEEEEVPKKPKAAKKYGSKSGAPKKKKKQFRYESKEERKITRRKERAGKKKKASARQER